MKTYKIPENLLREYFLNMQYRKKHFTLSSSGEAFSISKHKDVAGLELALLKKTSVPHYHTATAYFLFLEDAELQLGGLDSEGVAHVTSFTAAKGKVYAIPPYVLHAAGPMQGKAEVELLIFSPHGDRPRSSEYPDDTFMPEKIKRD